MVLTALQIPFHIWEILQSKTFLTHAPHYFIDKAKSEGMSCWSAHKHWRVFILSSSNFPQTLLIPLRRLRVKAGTLFWVSVPIGSPVTAEPREEKVFNPNSLLTRRSIAEAYGRRRSSEGMRLGDENQQWPVCEVLLVSVHFTMSCNCLHTVAGWTYLLTNWG